MDLFHRIDGSAVITRHKHGILKQGELYARGTTVYIRIGSGFCRIVQKLGSEFLTTHLDTKVLEFEGDGVITASNGLVSYQPPLELKQVA